MTEGEWLACTDPRAMLDFLMRSRALSDRKIRLFSAACCRRIWDRLRPSARAALEVAEQFADGLKDRSVLDRACSALPRRPMGSWAVAHAARPEAQEGARAVTYAAYYEAMRATRLSARGAAGNTERAAQCALLRCVFHPFRSEAVHPAWLAWNGGAIPKAAQAIYQERAFDRLPELADSLEQSGCDNADILSHCRGPGPHVRGCWVVDLLLGKE